MNISTLTNEEIIFIHNKSKKRCDKLLNDIQENIYQHAERAYNPPPTPTEWFYTHTEKINEERQLNLHDYDSSILKSIIVLDEYHKFLTEKNPD
jgi:hypothetical protein